MNEYRQSLTTIKIELKLDQFHVDELRIDWFVRNTHPHMLNLDDVTLKGLFQALLKHQKIGDLSKQ